jgi:hypothetical protein
MYFKIYDKNIVFIQINYFQIYMNYILFFV